MLKVVIARIKSLQADWLACVLAVLAPPALGFGAMFAIGTKRTNSMARGDVCFWPIADMMMVLPSTFMSRSATAWPRETCGAMVRSR